ncbi:hypothetical protein Q5H93_21800 [Hymenobacter sp. ASUV-10]|uniref:Baseplate J-like C-terminal domain-containing protein n=1 Tax=Hymenobacter aranciens TaxID=3063996 RepID=A0ABT9BL51_9BACT|nr:hypothetical protein [Hymenobacter sp. ASUV-10]MDO7877391.1 hypothetical protein [Hymenobacter sp. ASUV-10]
MARSIATIQAEMAAARAARAELAGLSSPSATSIYRLMEFVVAASIWAFETILDRFRDEVAGIIARAPAGTPLWYADRALEFQLDDELVILPSGKPGYGDGGTGARIVTRATAKEASTGKLFVKVAKDGATAGTLAALSNDELVQVRGYMDRLKFAGTRLEVVSREADRLLVLGTIYYDPLLPLATVRANAVAAVQGYLAALDFDGQVYVSKLVDALQAVAGVRDVEMVSVAARVGVAAPVAIPRVYETAAGYIVPEDTPGLTLLDTLTFVPDGQQ